MHKFFILALAVLMSGCASTQLSTTDEQQIKNIAIVSVLPETAVVQKIGLTVFNNEVGAIDMQGQIRTTILSAAGTSLKQSRPNWTIKEIDYDLPTLTKKMDSFGIVMSSSVEKIQSDLAELAKKNGVDAILVFSPAQYDSIPGKGAGVMFRTRNLSSIQYAYAHGTIAASVISQNGSLLAGAHNGFKLLTKPIDVGTYGIKYSLQDNLRPEISSKLAADICDALVQNVNVRLGELGL